jgi:hypothetical protein
MSVEQGIVAFGDVLFLFVRALICADDAPPVKKIKINAGLN